MFYHSLFYQTTKLIMEEDILNSIHQLSCFVGHPVFEFQKCILIWLMIHAVEQYLNANL